MNKEKFWKGVCAVSLAGTLLSGLVVLNASLDRKQAAKLYEEIRSRVKETAALLQPLEASAEELREQTAVFSEPELTEENEYLAAGIDFEQLKAENPDIYAWITVPGLEIDYPVLQDSQGREDYYLDHDAYQNESRAGAIYSEAEYNGTDFTDFHTVLYGHDMKDYSMFGGLLLYQEKSVLEKNNIIYIYLPERTMKYRIFAAYVSDGVHLLDGFNQEERLDRMAYAAELKYRCQEETCADQEALESLTEKSHILTLSTCYHGDKSKRFLVQAVLEGVKEEEN